MSVTNTGAFAQTAVRGFAKCTAAKTTYTDTTNAVTLLVSGANGSRVDSLSATPLATVTATQVTVFGTADGTTLAPLASGTVAAFTVTNIAALNPTSILKLDGSGIVSPTNPILLPPNYTMMAGIGVALATGIEVLAEGWNY